jgi:hypothetical protein
MKWLIENLFPAVAVALRGEGYQQAIADILIFKDKIYSGNVTLHGDQKEVTNCTFLGNDIGLKIVMSS